MWLMRGSIMTWLMRGSSSATHRATSGKFTTGWNSHHCHTSLPPLQVRLREGTDCADGIDTLILHLLASLSPARVADLEAFAAQSNSAVAGSQLRQLLQQRQLFQVLALVQGRAGEVEAALQTWQVGCRLLLILFAIPGCLMPLHRYHSQDACQQHYA